MKRKCSTRKLFLKISQDSQENTCVGASFLIKMQGFRPPNFIKKRLEHRCFREHWEIFKNTYFEEHLRTAASESFIWFSPAWTNNIRSEKDVFPKIKQNKNRSKTQLYEKKLAFSWCSLSFRCSLFLHFTSDGIFPTL